MVLFLNDVMNDVMNDPDAWVCTRSPPTEPPSSAVNDDTSTEFSLTMPSRE